MESLRRASLDYLYTVLNRTSIQNAGDTLVACALAYVAIRLAIVACSIVRRMMWFLWSVTLVAVVVLHITWTVPEAGAALRSAWESLSPDVLSLFQRMQPSARGV